MIDQSEMQTGVPKLRACTAFVGALDRVEHALRQRERHVRPGRHVGHGAKETRPPGLGKPAGTADLQALQIPQSGQWPAGAVPVGEPQVDPPSRDLYPKLSADLLG